MYLGEDFHYNHDLATSAEFAVLTWIAADDNDWPKELYFKLGYRPMGRLFSFTRVGPETLQYDLTVSDPTTWTKPWSATLFWTRSNEQIYEYACHEGNEGLSGALSGTRVQEREANAAATKGSK